MGYIFRPEQSGSLDDKLPKELVSAINKVWGTTQEVEEDGVAILTIETNTVNIEEVHVHELNLNNAKKSLLHKSAIIGSILVSISIGVIVGIEITTKYPDVAKPLEIWLNVLIQSF